MKEFVVRMLDSIEAKHVMITITSLIAALLSTRNDVGLPIYHRLANTTTGFVAACLSGFVLLEIGWAPWASSGMAYLVGHVGNRVMNALLTAAKMAEVDPFKFAGQVIGLVWSWKLPRNNNQDGSK